MKPTLGQTRKLIEQTNNSELDHEAMRFLVEEGFYTDLLSFVANPSLRRRMDPKKLRVEVQKVLGIVNPITGDNLFATPAEQLSIFAKINDERKLGFTATQFIELGPTPTEGAQGLIVWTLEATLENPVKTFEFIRSLMICPVSSDPEMYFAGEVVGLNPVCEWKPKMLRWVRIDLGADQGKIPRDVICKESAHCGPMWQAVYSPNWLASITKIIGGMFIPEVSLPGFLLKYSTKEELGGVPHIEPSRICQHNMCRSYTNSNIGQAALARYV